MTNDGQQTTDDEGRVTDAAIVAYLEKRFAPPPPDDRLRLDDDTSSTRIQITNKSQ